MYKLIGTLIHKMYCYNESFLRHLANVWFVHFLRFHWLRLLTAGSSTGGLRVLILLQHPKTTNEEPAVKDSKLLETAEVEQIASLRQDCAALRLAARSLAKAKGKHYM